MYPMDKIQVPRVTAGDVKDVPAAALLSVKPWPLFGVTLDQARECKQAYHAACSFVDAQIGRVLDTVDRLKLWDHTVVVFWSDHGYHLGEHGLWMKQSLFENSCHVPLVIVAPNAAGNGRTSPRTVEFVDLYPTLAELAGLHAPSNLEGKSLKPLLENPQGTWERPAYTQVWRGTFSGHSVRTERYRYTEWDGGNKGVQFYDYEKDPLESKNLAPDPQYAGKVAELKALVAKHWEHEYKPSQDAGDKKGQRKKKKGEVGNS
jgi:uncharacterized sulfatase